VDSGPLKAPVDCRKTKEVRQKSIVLIETSGSTLEVKNNTEAIMQLCSVLTSRTLKVKSTC